MDESTVQPSKRRPWLIAGIAAVVLFLAGAAYVGAGLLARPQVAAAGSGGIKDMVVETKDGPGGAKQSVRLEIVPAKELPGGKGDVGGVFVRREDNSLYVGTGNVRVMVTKGDGAAATPQSSTSYDGPIIEVVVTHDTQVWRDETDMGLKEPGAGGASEKKIQQVVVPGSLDDLTPNSSVVNVWGEKRGDRVIARVLSYRG